MNGSFNFLPLEKVFYGPGSVENLPRELDRLQRRAVLIITGRTLAEETPLVNRLEALIGERHAGTYSGIRQHVPEEDIAGAVLAAIEVGADLLLSVGGGSPIDAAKSVAMKLSQHKKGTLPHIAVPTTLSAAEFSHMAGYTDAKSGEKTGFADPSVTPQLVVLDPDLTLYTPEWLWSASGLRSLDHAVETLYSPGYHPINDVLALEAVSRLFTFLPLAYEDPADTAVKLHCQLAAWMSFFGPASVQYGLSHRIGRIIGATYGVAHGITSAITLPHVMRLKVSAESARLAPVARRLNLGELGTSDVQLASAAAGAVASLVERLDLPSRLRDVGIPKDDLADIANKAALQMSEDPSAVNSVLEAAW